MQIRVYYEDTDAGGIVYHSKYLNFCERARSEIFFMRKKSPIFEANSGFVVKSIEAKFLKTSKLGDILDIKTELIWIKRASVALKQTIYRGGEVVFMMDVVLVYLRNNRPSKIPQESMEILKGIAIFKP